MVDVNTGMRLIFDGSWTGKQNISEFIDMIDPRDIPLLAILGWGTEAGTVNSGQDSLAFPCLNTTHTWQSDELIPSQGVLTSGYTSGGGTLTIGTTAELYWKVGDQILIDDVHYEVTVLNGNGTIDVVVVDGSSDADHDNGSRWDNLGTLRTDGEEFASPQGTTGSGTLTQVALRNLSTDLVTVSNYTQIFQDIVSVSGTTEAVEKFGITNEFEREFAKRFEEVVIRLERAAHYGLANSLPANNTDRTTVRRMGGLFSFIRNDGDANVTDGSGDLLTELTLNNLLENIWDDGGKPDTILVGATQKRVLDNFATPFVRTERTEDTIGVVVATYESTFGTLNIVLDRYVKPADLIILQTEYIGIGALKGNGNDRSFFVQDVPTRGDMQEAAITGEYTMEVRNATRAHGWIHDLSTTLV